MESQNISPPTLTFYFNLPLSRESRCYLLPIVTESYNVGFVLFSKLISEIFRASKYIEIGVSRNFLK